MEHKLFKTSIDKNVTGYKVVLSYMAYEDGTPVTRYAEFDLVENGVTVNSSVEISSYPTLLGYNISDHIYRQPVTISLRGKFGENGLKAMNWIGTDRLTTIQNEFEVCQRAGVKFSVYIIKNENVDDANRRYIVRHNQVLKDITWTENQDSMEFDFRFQEAISNKVEQMTVVRDYTDPNLPALTDLEPASLVGEVISSDEVIKMIVESLRSMSLLNDETIQRCVAGAAISSVVSGIAKLAVVGSVLLTIATGASTVPVVGWIVGAGIALAASIVSVVSIVKAFQQAAKINYYKSIGHAFLIEDGMSDEEKDEVANRFVEFLVKTKQKIDDSLSEIAVYRIAKADRQETVLTMNGNYYVQRIEKNDDDLTFRIKSYVLGNVDKCNASKAKIVGLANFADCDDTRSSVYFFDIDDPRYRVYIINRATYMQEMMNQETTEDKLNGKWVSDKEKYEMSKNELLDFAFVTAPYPLTDLTNKLAELIKDAIDNK